MIRALGGRTMEDKVEKFGVVVGGALRLRAKPNATSDVLTLMPDKAKVTILSDRYSEFYRVSYNGTCGYCVKKFIKKEK